MLSGGPLTPICPLEQLTRATGSEFSLLEGHCYFLSLCLEPVPLRYIWGRLCIFTVCSDKAIMGNEQRLGKSVASFFLILLDLDCS